MNRRGFTIIELVIVITIMGVLMTLGVVNLRSSQANSRDTERRLDIETIAQHLESYYSGGADDTVTKIDCTGGNVTHDGAYTVHKFTTSGTLVCTGSFTAEVLVVAGGGGTFAAGGGGGGVLTGNMTLTGSMAVVIGAGGLTGGGDVNERGGNTTFGGATANGGGGGAGWELNGYAGGSGGAAGHGELAGKVGGAATQGNSGGLTGYGNKGGDNIYHLAPYATAGGGGAGGTGSNALSTSQAGNGGAGINSDIVLRGTNVGYGGGGGGSMIGSAGTAGTGSHGGGNGSRGTTAGTAGATNTGGGAGGGSDNYSGFMGGSGIVVVRYLTPIGIGTYPSTTTLFSGTPTLDSIKLALRDINPDSLIAPGLAVIGDDDTTIATHVTTTFIAATNNTQTTAGVLPQPTIDQYVYQPLHSDGSLCNDTAECRKFNLYYRSEVDNSVNMVSSVNQ